MKFMIATLADMVAMASASLFAMGLTVGVGLLSGTPPFETRALAQTPAAAATEPAATGPTIRIDNFTFGPAIVTVHPGTTVTWINGDDIPHTVVASDHSFKSKVLDTDGKFSFTFAKPGEYAYFCSIHPHMVGKIVVKAG